LIVFRQDQRQLAFDLAITGFIQNALMAPGAVNTIPYADWNPPGLCLYQPAREPADCDCHKDQYKNLG